MLLSSDSWDIGGVGWDIGGDGWDIAEAKGPFKSILAVTFDWTVPLQTGQRTLPSCRFSHDFKL